MRSEGDRVSENAVKIGIYWMIASTICLSVGNSAVRVVAADLHPFQISFMANTLILAVVWPAFKERADPIHRPTRRRLYTFTAFFGGISNLTWFYALANVPLAEATAVTFAAPILVTALAGVMFGEKVGLERWLAVLAGFSGVILIVLPGFTALDAGMVAVLISTVGMAALYVLSKQLTRVEGMRRAAAMMTAIPVVIGAIPAVWVWKTPSLSTMGWIVVMAAVMYGGRMSMLLAFRNAPASVVMPLDFGRLPFIAAIAYVAFGEVPDGIALAGAALIVVASGYVALRPPASGGQSVA